MEHAQVDCKQQKGLYILQQKSCIGQTEKTQTYDFENEDFLKIDISRGISGAQKLKLM